VQGNTLPGRRIREVDPPLVAEPSPPPHRSTRARFALRSAARNSFRREKANRVYARA
jgi:hypothetical protein